MADVITDLAVRSGISPDMARMGMGAVLGFCKDKLPADLFSKVSASVPGADNIMAAAAQTSRESSGGESLLSSVTGMFGKMFGGGGADLAGTLAKVGFSPNQLQTFLPQVAEFLKSKLPADRLQNFSGLLPSPDSAQQPTQFPGAGPPQ